MFSSWSTPLASVSTATVWSTVKSPPVMLLIVPFICGGTMILCRMAVVSWTVPITSPPVTAVPGCTTGSKCQTRSRLSAGTSMPRVMLEPVRSRISGSGRWIPS